MAQRQIAGSIALLLLVAVVTGVVMALIGSTFGLAPAVAGGVTSAVVAASAPLIFRRRS